MISVSKVIMTIVVWHHTPHPYLRVLNGHHIMISCTSYKNMPGRQVLHIYIYIVCSNNIYYVINL